MEDVTAFHRLVSATIGDVAKPDATVDMKLRLKLIAEEMDELLDALAPGVRAQFNVRDAVNAWLIACHAWPEKLRQAPDLPAVADALADLAYVTVGANVTWGIPGAAVWSEVHAANMRKANGPKDPQTGKALKPPGWTPPDIEGVLARAKDPYPGACGSCIDCCEDCATGCAKDERPVAFIGASGCEKGRPA